MKYRWLLIVVFFCNVRINYSQELSEQKKISEEKSKYLSNNKLVIYTNSNKMILYKKDSTIKNYTFFFVGENHSHNEINQFIQLELFKYLDSQVKISNILLEYGYSHEWLANNYLKRGKYIYIDGKNLLSDNDKLEDDFYRYLLNKSEAERNEIVFKAIDIEYFFKNALSLLYVLLPDEDSVKAPYSIAHYIDKLNTVSDIENDETLFLSDSLVKNFEANNTEYYNYIGTKYLDFNKIIGKIKEGVTYEDLRKKNTALSNEYRENYMANSIKTLVDTNKKEGKYFGQLGIYHIPTTIQDVWAKRENWNSLASKLNNNNQQVCSFFIFYNKNYDDLLQYGFSQDDISVIKSKLLSKEKMVLYKLDAVNTPFKHLTNRFKYLIIVNDSP